MPTSRRHDAIALAVIFAAALAVFGPPLARNEVFTFRDHTDYFSPMRLYTAMHLRAGKLPLWNPYNGSGEEWLANPQTGVFYPPAWLFLVLPFATAYVVYLFVHSVILGWGAYRLLRLRAGPAASTVGGVALLLSGPVLSLLDVQNNFTSLAWVPWVIWCALRDREREGAPRLAAVLLALAFLAGEPFYAAMAALLYVVIVGRPKTVAVAGIGAVGVSAVQLFPFVDLMIGSDRFGGFAAEDILRNSMRGIDWLRLFVPPRLLPPGPREAQHFIFVVYAGVLVCALAAAGAVVLWRRSRTEAAGWLLLLGVSLAVASGPSILARLPLTIFRYPSRLLPFAAIAIVVLAAAGWEGLRRKSIIVDAVLVLAVAADLLLAVHPLLATAPADRKLLAYPPSIGRSAKFVQIYGSNPLHAGSRIAWMSGYLNLHQQRFSASTPAPLSPRAYTAVYDRALTDLELVRRIGVAWVIVPGLMPPPFVQAARVENVYAYRIPGALPMAYVRSGDGKIVPPRSLALDATSSRVAVSTASGGLLVLTQNDARGWRVSIDGKPAAKRVVDGTFRAVQVPPGLHEVIWKFRPPSLIAGLVATLLAMVWLATGSRQQTASSE